MQVHLDLTDKTPFFIRPFTVKEDMKTKIDREMDRLVKLGILKKGLSGYSSPAMAIYPGKIVTYQVSTSDKLLEISDKDELEQKVSKVSSI